MIAHDTVLQLYTSKTNTQAKDANNYRSQCGFQQLTTLCRKLLKTIPEYVFCGRIKMCPAETFTRLFNKGLLYTYDVSLGSHNVNKTERHTY